MSFEAGRKTGKLWEDIKQCDKILIDFNYNRSNKNEREFENSLSSIIGNLSKNFNNTIITQQDRNTTVQSVHCFGKNNRPDMAIGNDGLAIEIKYISTDLDGFKKSLGQGYIYRLRYKFVIIALVLSQSNCSLYNKIINGEEKDLEDILEHLASLNIFYYIFPAFKTKSNQKKFFRVDYL